MKKIKILFLAANPINSDPLRLTEEIREISHKIQISRFRQRMELFSVWAVRPGDLQQSLLEHEPDIVHFSGHGSDSNEIILEDSDGFAKKVSGQAISALLKVLKDKLRLVVLNACYSRSHCEAITEHIDSAIGMKTAIGDKAAIGFAASFYQAIGYGRTLDEAFELGRNALMLENIPEENTPELVTRSGVSATEVILLDSSSDSDSNQDSETRKLVERFLIFLEDRRAIWFPQTRMTRKAEVSVDQVRDELTKAIQAVPPESSASSRFRRMRQACRDFLEEIEIDNIDEVFNTARRKMQMRFVDEVFAIADEYSITLSKELILMLMEILAGEGMARGVGFDRFRAAKLIHKWTESH